MFIVFLFLDVSTILYCKYTKRFRYETTFLQILCLIGHLRVNDYDFFAFFRIKEIFPIPIGVDDREFCDVFPILITEIDYYLFIKVKIFYYLCEVGKCADKLSECHILVFIGYAFLIAKSVPN